MPFSRAINPLRTCVYGEFDQAKVLSLQYDTNAKSSNILGPNTNQPTAKLKRPTLCQTTDKTRALMNRSS